MKTLVVLSFLGLVACAPYKDSSQVRDKIKVKVGERQAAEAQAAEEARIAAAEARALRLARAEALSLRSAEIDKLMKDLDAASGMEAEKLAQYPKLVFSSQMALDQTTVVDVRARQEKAAAEKAALEKEEKDKVEKEKEKEESEGALPLADEPVENEKEKEAGKAEPVKVDIEKVLVDHVKGSCVLYTVAEKPFVAADIASTDIQVSPAGRVIVAKLVDQQSETCQAFFEKLLGAQFKTDYFALHTGFVALPQDTP